MTELFSQPERVFEPQIGRMWPGGKVSKAIPVTGREGP
jgi:hypothetical protein